MLSIFAGIALARRYKQISTKYVSWSTTYMYVSWGIQFNILKISTNPSHLELGISFTLIVVIMSFFVISNIGIRWVDKIKIKKLYLTSHITNRQHKLNRAFIATNKVSINKYSEIPLLRPPKNKTS